MKGLVLAFSNVEFLILNFLKIIIFSLKPHSRQYIRDRPFNSILNEPAKSIVNRSVGMFLLNF